MKPILTRLFAGLFLLLASQAFGQMTTNFVVTSTGPYPIGSHIVIELRVTNFTNIESMQFPITYNKDGMRFDSLTNSAFSNWNAGNYVSNAGAGKVGISWDGYSNGANMPFTFPNGTALFRLHFTVIGNGTATVNISAAAAPPAIDVVGGGQPVVLNYLSGGTPTITLGSGNPPPPPLVGFKIIGNSIYIPQGERGCMPVTVNDFDNIISMQWAMHWNNSVLNFDCTRNYNLSGWSATDFNPNFLPGTLVAGWSDPAGVGVTRVDGARIVDVCFKAIGAPGANTTVTIDGMNMPPTSGTAEAYNASSVNVWTFSGVNGASGVSAPITIIVTPVGPSDVKYTVDTISAAPNTQGCVAVKVKNFTAVTNSEFALAYNPAELTYTTTQFGANPLNLQASNITVPALPAPPNPLPALNYVKFLWANTNGATVANDAAIFSACFTVIAAPPTKSNITFATTACPTVTGIGTALASGGVPMGMVNGWIKSVPSGPTLVPTPVSCNGGNTGSIALTNPPSTTATNYAWAGQGVVQGQQNQSGLVAGTYTVTVTYTGGTTGTGTAIITQPAPLLETHTVNTVSCFGGSNGAINLTPSGGTNPYTYMWSNGSTAEDPSGLTVDIYTVTIKDSKNCTLGPVNITVSGFSAITLQNAAVVTPVTCTGLSTGAIAITPSGGAGGYTYDWSNNGPQNPDTDPKDLVGMPAGTYTVTVTDANGCTAAFTSTITTPQPLVTNLDNKTNVKCSGTATGAANITVTGGTGTINYCWTTGAGPCSSQMEDPNLPAGTFTVIATDQNGCTSTIANVVITNPPSPMTVTGATTPSPCFDQPNGAINAAASGGWPGSYQYAWSGPISPIPPVPNPSPLPGGIYTVTVTDAGQCTNTQTFTVSGAPAITEAKTIQNVTCFGQDNGGINLHLAGGNPAYNVAWSNTTLTGESIGNLAPNSYQPTVTDAQGCTKVFPAVVVTGPQVLVMDTTITAANPGNGAIELIYMSGGTGDPNTWMYSWTGPNGFTASTRSISGLAIGDYTVVIKDSNGCERTFTYNVPSGNVVASTTIFSIKNACDHDGGICLSIPQTATGQTPFTVNWGFGTMQTNSFSPCIFDLGAGIYNVTVTAANGNSVVLSAIQIAQLDPASVNSNTQDPFSSLLKNGKIKLTQAPGVLCQLTYQWGPAPLNSTASEVTNLSQGTYTVTITNPCSMCVSVQSFTLTYGPLDGIADLGNPNCASTADGFINVNLQGGNLPYHYQWTGPNGYTSTQEDISGLAPGVYTLVATDQDNRVFNKSYTLTSQSNLLITNVNELSNFNGWQVSGATVCDGVATVAFTPGIGNSNIVWSNGVTGANNNTLCGGAYSVTVTDAAGCSSVWSDALTAPPAIEASQLSAGVACHGDCDGSAKVFATGGVEPYAVHWSTGQSDPLVFTNSFSQAVNLCGGDYTVTITDKNGVDKVYTVTVPQPAEIVATFAETTPRNFNACDGELLLNTEGAVDPITYVWSGSFGHSGEGERAINLCSGEFVEYIITDANGCTAYAADSVPYPEDGCFRVSPVLTPGQQDGKNDNVHITCIETSLKNHIEIYNRWGQLVFQTDGYSNDDSDREHNWNGLTSSGVTFAEGVYYYVLTYSFLDDQGVQHEGVHKGAINLLQ